MERIRRAGADAVRRIRDHRRTTRGRGRAAVRDHRSGAGTNRGAPRPKVRDHRRERHAGPTRSDRSAAAGGVTTTDATRAFLARLDELFVNDRPGVFLAVPTVRIPIDGADLTPLVDLGNRVPSGRPTWSVPDRMLWDVVDWTLREADIASAPPSTDEETELDAALNLLFTDRETAEPTEALTRYRELRDAFLAAGEKLASARAALDSGDGDAAAVKDAEGDVEAARKAWAVDGHRGDVEEALELVERLGDRNPLLAWDAASTAFELARLTDAASGNDFWETELVPPSLEQDHWTPLQLDLDALEELAETGADIAPEWDRVLLLDGEQDDRLESLRSRVAAVSLRRRWFRPSLLETRSWRWTGDEEPLSDGGDPPEGMLPAYVVGVVVADDVELDRVGGTSPRTAQRRRRASPSRETTTVAARRLSVARRAPDATSDEKRSAFVAAFVCRRLDRAPDPDPDLFEEER